MWVHFPQCLTAETGHSHLLTVSFNLYLWNVQISGLSKSSSASNTRPKGVVQEDTRENLQRKKSFSAAWEGEQDGVGAGGRKSQPGSLLGAKPPVKGHSNPSCSLKMPATGHAFSPQGQTSCLLAHCCPQVPRKGHRVRLSRNTGSAVQACSECVCLWPHLPTVTETWY